MSNEPMMDVTSDDKLWAALSYATMFVPFSLPVGAIIILLLEDKRNRPFIKTHAIQALVTWGVVLALSFVAVGLCLLPFVFFASFYWAYQAYQGQDVNIPMLSDFIHKQGWA